MKHLLIISGALIVFLTAYTTIRSPKQGFSKEAYDRAMAKKALGTISCTPDWRTYYLSAEQVQDMVPLPGTGTHTWKISTKSDSAQFYFNQGINLYYGFHIAEAMPSFKKAQLFDSSCAMLYWAEALAYGPNINDLGYFASPDALLAAQKAEDLSKPASKKERALINAMWHRYSADTTVSREILNEHYASLMQDVFDEYPKDPEIGALYADALMVQHPWDLWQHNGRPQPWEPRIQTTLEKVLRYDPDHPGANHYYIHTMEASPFAYKALPSADRLARLAPGLSHMVHMPSHIYIRTGNYEKGEAVNAAAVAAYHKYLTIFPAAVNGAPLYEIHNLHMRAACSMNGNDYTVALRDANACRQSIDPSYMGLDAPMGDFVQYVYMEPMLTMVTFKKWDEILSNAALPDSLHYASAIQQFAYGMADAGKDMLQPAKAALAKMDIELAQNDMAVIFPPFNSPKAAGAVARDILAGTIAEKENDMSTALILFRRAVTEEDALVYNEPRDWLIPARHYLGNALLDAGNKKEAAAVFKEDLRVQPNNEIAKEGLKKSN